MGLMVRDEELGEIVSVTVLEPVEETSASNDAEQTVEDVESAEAWPQEIAGGEPPFAEKPASGPGGAPAGYFATGPSGGRESFGARVQTLREGADDLVIRLEEARQRLQSFRAIARNLRAYDEETRRGPSMVETLRNGPDYDDVVEIPKR